MGQRENVSLCQGRRQPGFESLRRPREYLMILPREGCTTLSQLAGVVENNVDECEEQITV